MRKVYLFFILALVTYIGQAQPANDDCVDATQLNLTQAPSCPSTTAVVDNFSFDNFDATPVSPFPFFNCPDGMNGGPGAEVWFSFVATANITTINLTGFAESNMVIYLGDDCVFLQALNCTGGAANGTMVTNTLIGETYHLLVSGGDVDDQANFDLTFTSNNVCDSCAPPGAIALSFDPPPINGTFSSGSIVQVCASINEWDAGAAATAEWFHAITWEIGSGWLPITEANTIPPAALYPSGGNWAWYDTWTSCFTNQVFTNGFAFDSPAGLGCGGVAGDNDPGNNWGDGNPFTGVGDISPSNPLVFCIDMQVSDCPPIITGEDLGISINIWSDGDSGSWTQTGCNTGQSFSITSSAICCNDDLPIATAYDNTCTGGGNGYIEMEGNGGIDPSEVFNFFVLDNLSNVIYECIGCSGLVSTDQTLPSGDYTIIALNVANDCANSTNVTISDNLPTASAQITNTPCESNGVDLSGSINNAAPGAAITYEWTGPDATIYPGQDINAPDEGTYTLVVTVDGCPAQPVDIDVVFTILTTTISGVDEVCHGEQTVLLASGDGNQFSWVNLTTNENLGTDNPITLTLDESSTIQVTATDSNSGCSTTDQYDVIINPIPQLTIDIIGSFCANEPITLTASGLDDGFYEWQDDPSAPNPRIITGLAPGSHLFVVTGTTAAQCSSMADAFFNIQAVPDVTFTVTPDPVCDGDMATVTLSGTGINMIDWNGAGPANQNPITVTVNGNTMLEATVTNASNCTEFFNTTITPDTPPAPTVISCGANTPTSVIFNWTAVPGATSYTVTVMGQAPQTTTNTTLTVDNLMPNETVTITVQPTGDDLCEPASTTFSCTTQACPNINLAITPVDLICLGDFGVPLSLMFTADDMTGTATWSGDGIIDAANGTFDPQTAGTGDHIITIDYPIGDCMYSDMITIMIRQIPTSDFLFNDLEVCTNEEITINYVGNATASATFNWDFAGGTAVPGTGIGPHFVTWDTPGNHVVSLTVAEDGCTSEVFNETASVSEPLSTPTITCINVSTSSVTFSWNDIIGSTDYIVNVLTGQTGSQSGTTMSFDNLAPNETVTIELTVDTDNPCGTVTTTHSCTTDNCPPFTINIDPLMDICLTGNNSPITLTATVTGGNGGSLTWAGPGVTGDQFNPAAMDAGAGQHTIIATYTEGDCMSTATTTVNVFSTPTADFTIAPSEVCINDDAMITYNGTAGAMATYTWNFNGGVATPGTGAGPHTVNWPTGGNKTVSLTVSENGCVSSSATQMISVLSPIATPVINCAPSTSDIVFSWNAVTGASSYIVNLISAPPGATTIYDDIALTYTVSGLNANESVEIEVIAVDNGPCPNSSTTQTCVAENCPMVMIDIDAVAPICLDANASTVNLNAVITGGAGGGSEFWSGTGITDTIGIFDPADSGAGTWTANVTYTEGNCQYNASTEIVVNAQPTANFTVDPNICQTSTATAIYTGSASAGATYNWDFGTATAIPGTGAGPHTLSWPAGGIQSISLIVTENNCASEVFNASAQVDETLAQPVITCDATTSTITFSWGAVPDATGYIVNVISIPATAAGVYDDVALTYSVTGLNAGESVEIEVVAEGDGACGNSSQNFSCVAQNCPTVTIDIDPVMDICLDTNATAVTLNATTAGGMGNGSQFWSGIGITDTLGVFDPNDAGAGDWTITVTYTEGICEYTETIDITVNPQPTADFSIDNMDICQEQTVTITYDGTAAVNAMYNWDFDGGTALPGAGQGPHTVSWANSGTPMISLTVTENDCASEPFSAMLTVSDSLIAPVVGCDSDNTSITFSWEPVTGATSYTVNVINEPAGASGVFDDVALTYTYLGLMPGDAATIQVNVLTDSPCGGVSSEMTCTAQSCNPLAFEEITFGPYCADADLQNLATTIGDNSGIFTWSGAGVDNTAATFDPMASGTGMIPVGVQYALDGCVYDTTYQIIVNTVPTASFTVDSPICVDNTTTLTFDGSASATAVYSWDLDSGNIQGGTDPGPYMVGWMDAGDYVITLDVTDNGCISNTFSLPVMVEEIIAPVEIVCQSTSSSAVTFAWDPVDGADTYDVTVIAGPTGIQTGNTYAMTGLTPDQTVTIEVTASGSSTCGPSTATGTCIAQACQPLTLTIDGSPTLCTGDNGQVNFDFTTDQAGPFEVTYTVNGIQEQIVLDGDGMISFDNLTVSTTVEVISIMDVNITECIYPGGQMWAIEVDQMVEAGQVGDNVSLCEGENQPIDLNTLLSGADANGIWTETSTPSSTGGAFNATSGSFNTSSQAAQDYSFVYTVAGGACPDDTAQAGVVISAAPVADAGQNQMLSCQMGTATLGGNGTTSGQTYLWTSTNPDAIIADPTNQFTEISSPGDYTLEVTNATGCSDTDEVAVSAEFDVPVANVSISDPTCFEMNDGNIIIDDVEGGVAPYTFSLNGGAMTTNTFFGNLNPGEYSLIVQGGNDCFTELFINIEQPEEVVVELVANIQNGGNIINLGETVVLEALYSPNINVDTIIWKPDSLNTETLNNINVTPIQTSTYTVTLIDANGCADTDDMTIIVQKPRPVYIPSAFSPDDSGTNDIFYVAGGSEIKQIKSFLIFNRWGESVFENHDFAAGDPAQGWDGKHRGQILNPAVFVYFIEVEFSDGVVILYKGDVMLMR